MIQSSKSNGDVVVFEFSGVQTLESHQQSLSKLSAVLDEHKSVIFVRIYHDTQSLTLSDEMAKLTTMWLEHGGGEQIRHHVCAMLYIVPDEVLDKMSGVDVPKTFGVKGNIFSDKNNAIEWLKENIDSTLPWKIPIGIDTTNECFSG